MTGTLDNVFTCSGIDSTTLEQKLAPNVHSSTFLTRCSGINSTTGKNVIQATIHHCLPFSHLWSVFQHDYSPSDPFYDNPNLSTYRIQLQPYGYGCRINTVWPNHTGQAQRCTRISFIIVVHMDLGSFIFYHVRLSFLLLIYILSRSSLFLLFQLIMSHDLDHYLQILLSSLIVSSHHTLHSSSFISHFNCLLLHIFPVLTVYKSCTLQY